MVGGAGVHTRSLWVTYKLLPSLWCRVFTIKEAMMLKKVVLAGGLIAIPSIAPAQQQQCQLECTITGQRETKVTKSCHALNASDCANLGRGESGGNKTCRGYITSNCVAEVLRAPPS
jgi:hypothetical protein